MSSRGYYNDAGGAGGQGYFSQGNRGYAKQISGGLDISDAGVYTDPITSVYDPTMHDPYYYDAQGMQMPMGSGEDGMGDEEYFDDGMRGMQMGPQGVGMNLYGGQLPGDVYNNELPASMPGGATDAADLDADMSWGEHSVLYPIEQAATTALQFDDAVEMLWCGDSSGRITAHQLLSGGYEMDRYASFKVAECPVLELLPMYESIASVTERSVRVHSRGGVPLATFDLLGDDSDFTFTCGNVVKYAAESGHIPISILAGTSTQYVNIYDAATASALGSFDAEYPTVRISSNAYYVAVAGSDGKVRLMDPRLRSPHVIHTIVAHTGSITDMVLDTEGYSLATCGMNGRALNPYDPKSPIMYKPDAFIRLFDLRMPQSSSQVSMLSITPSFLRLLPSALDLLIGANSSVDAMPPPSVLMASSDGLVQFAFPPDETSSESTLSPVVMTSAVDLPVGALTAVAPSSSGRLIAIGTESGAVISMSIQHVVTDEEEALWSEIGDPANAIVAGSLLPPVVNMSVTPVMKPPAQPTVPKYVAVDDAVLSTSYVLTRYPINNPVPTASSLATTPKYAERKMKFQNTRKLSDSVASAAVMQGFMGHLPNPGFPMNNMIYGNSRKNAYYAGDVRVIAAMLTSGARASGAGADSDTGGYMSAHEVIPQRYRRVQSHRGKSRMKQFNYHEFNAIGSSVVGLENAIERPWINPIIQLLFSFADICVYALESQSRVFHHSQSPNSLWCELGFLFHSMLVVRDSINGQEAKAVASASNFHTVFYHCPAAAAVGLLQDALKTRSAGDDVLPGGQSGNVQSANDSAPRSATIGAVSSTSNSNVLSSDSYAIRLQQSLQIFIRFLFQQLSKEADLEGKFNASKGISWKHGSKTLFTENPDSSGRNAAHSEDVVDSLFGITLRSSTTFLQSGTVDIGATHRVSTLDLAYPPVATSSAAALNVKATPTPDATTKALANFLEETSKLYPHSVSLRSKWVTSNASSKPSFCCVFWNTIVKETFMRGWCSASETYEPFRQIKTVDVASMPDFLALLCGDTLPPSNAPSSISNDVATTASAAADPVVTIAREKTAIGGLWRGPNCFQTGPWLPVEIEIYRVPSSAIGLGERHSASPQKPGKPNQSSHSVGDMIFVSERIQIVHPHHHSVSSDAKTSAGSGGMSLDESHQWLIFNGTCYITSSVPASVLFRSAIASNKSPDSIDNSAGDALSYELYSIVSHIDSSNSGAHNGSNDTPSHAVVHMRKYAYGQSQPESSTLSGVGDGKDASSWVLINDFSIAPSDDSDATTFATWRHPDAIFLSKIRHSSSSSSDSIFPRLNLPGAIRTRPVVPESVMTLPSLSSKPSVRPPPVAQLPRLNFITRLINAPLPPELSDARFVAFDAEFVTVEVDEVQLDTRGQQVIGREGRQVIARISLLAEAPLQIEGSSTATSNSGDAGANNKNASKKTGKSSDNGSKEQGVWKSEIKLPAVNLPMNSMTRHIQPNASLPESTKKELLGANVVPLTLLCDDYILPSEKVVDYVTRFSGLTADDLNPAISTHALIPHRSAILKLRSYLDRNCIFVGHGLQKDFETANIYVPPEQIRDTVELWRLPGQRKVSLRFLAAFLLGADIQDEIHDSIEDAKTAFSLYLLYEKANALYGPEGIQAILHDLYDFGHANSWTLGLDRINNASR